MTRQTIVNVNNTKRLILLGIFIILIFAFVGCISSSKANEYSIEQFTNDMKSKNYNFELQDTERDFLPTTRKRLIIGDEAIEIYLYRSSKAMEKDSKRIDSGGCSYSSWYRTVYVTWISNTYFYKKGNIIVQYVGENEKIISDLKDILGEHFAGHKVKNNESK